MENKPRKKEKKEKTLISEINLSKGVDLSSGH